MKKIYMLAAAAIFTTTAFAQVNTAVVNEEKSFITDKEQALLDQITIKKLNSSSNYSNFTNKGPVNGRADYAARLADVLSGSVEYSFANPIMPDSTTFIGFDDGAGGFEYVNTTSHAIGMVYDPTEAFFGTQQFKAADVVNVDSLFVDGAYWINNSAHTNDSIIFRVFVTPPTSAGPLTLATFSGLDGLTGDVTIPYLDYTGSVAHGVHDGITGTATARYGYQLSDADSAGTVAIGIQTSGLTIPAGSVMAVYVEYLPTSFAEGDTTNLITDTGAFNAFRPLIVANSGGSGNYNNFTGLSNGSNQHNSIVVFNETRYSATSQSTGNTDGTSYLVSSVSYSIYATVSGNSTVGINEVEKSLSFNVFPNPSNGIFNINLSSNEANNVNLSVKNVVGQTVLTETVNVSGNTNHQISLTDYSKGIYFLTVGSETVKLIVE